jgi:NAD(P)-dependent dehydrogenase (short-subunit alcohol dehydrogenase family)
MLLKDETVIVTGASGNLGSAVARLVAAQGARVVCVDRTAANHAGISAGLDPDRHLMLAGYDLSGKEGADAMLAAVTAKFDRVTALVNTVGGFRTGRVTAEAPDHWDLMMLLNARVAMVTSAVVLPALVAAGGGSVVHISASPGQKAAAGQAAYAASKAAVIRLVEAIAAEHRKDRISANCILPGTIDTPQNRAAMPDAKPDIWISPAAIAEVIAFLISPPGRLVTGAAIPATGLI